MTSVTVVLAPEIFVTQTNNFMFGLNYKYVRCDQMGMNLASESAKLEWGKFYRSCYVAQFTAEKFFAKSIAM